MRRQAAELQAFADSDPEVGVFWWCGLCLVGDRVWWCLGGGQGGIWIVRLSNGNHS